MGVIDRRIAELAREQHDVVDLRQLRGLGAADGAVKRRLADHRLYCLFRGVYAVGTRRITQRGWWKAATLAAGPNALLSHGDAAALMDLARRPGRDIHVTVIGRKPHQQPGLHVHTARSLDPADRSEIDGIPVTALPRTLLDLAESVTPLELQRAYERAEELQILDTRAIQRLLARSNGRRGVGPLTALLGYDPTAAAEAESELSRLFLDLVREGGLPEPQTTVLVDGYLVDAFWPEANLIVELDGYEFHKSRRQFERDREKAVRLRLAGRTFIALTYRQVTEKTDWVLRTVRRLVAADERPTPASS